MILEIILLKIQEKTTIDPTTNCFLYNGPLDKDGYGVVGLNCKQERVHRISLYHKLNLDLGFDDTNALHILTCPNKNCWNPDHLYAGNKLSNNIDTMISGNNFNSSKTHCRNGHKYDEQNTYLDKKGWRRCKKCHAERTKARWTNARDNLLEINKNK